MKANQGWIAVDLDSTLAHYDKWRGIDHIGEPVPAMVALVKAYLAKGIKVKIMTARVARELELDNGSPSGDFKDAELVRTAIVTWCEKHIGQALEITCAKDLSMIALYDDQCVQVEPNTGVALVDYYQDAAELMNKHLEEIRVALGLTNQKDIMKEIRRLVK